MCGVTRAPFNSNRSSCGIEVVVPFFPTEIRTRSDVFRSNAQAVIDAFAYLVELHLQDGMRAKRDWRSLVLTSHDNQMHSSALSSSSYDHTSFARPGLERFMGFYIILRARRLNW